MQEQNTEKPCNQSSLSSNSLVKKNAEKSFKSIILYISSYKIYPQIKIETAIITLNPKVSDEKYLIT